MTKEAPAAPETPQPDGDLQFGEDGLDPGKRQERADEVAAEVSPDPNTDQSQLRPSGDTDDAKP